MKRPWVSGGIPLEAKLRPTGDVGNRIHTHGKICVEANRLQHSLASNIVAGWKLAHRDVVTINSEMLLPVFMSNVAHGIFLLDQLGEGNKPKCQLLKRRTWFVLDMTAREGKKPGLQDVFHGTSCIHGN